MKNVLLSSICINCMLLLLYSLFFCVSLRLLLLPFLQNSDAMISTPTGKFGQLISKIFMNVDKLLPALYGGVLSTILNLLVGVILLGIFFGPISFVLIVLYIAFTIAAYRAARQTGTYHYTVNALEHNAVEQHSLIN